MKKLLFFITLGLSLITAAQRHNMADTLKNKTAIFFLPPMHIEPANQLEDSLLMSPAEEKNKQPDFQKTEMIATGSAAEQRAYLSKYAMVTGSQAVSEATQADKVMFNKDVMAITSDLLGKEGITYADRDSMQTFLKPLQNGEWAVCFINNSSKPKELFFPWKNTTISYPEKKYELNVAKNNFRLLNLWTASEIGTTAKPVNCTINTHDVLLLRLVKQDNGKKQ